jgi:hypothetical protein
MAVTRVWKPSQHYSSGGNARRVIALHTTEGSQTAESLLNWLTNPSSKVSYHFAVDASHGDSWCMQYVRDGDKAWAQANFNGAAISIAFCTPSGAASGWSRSTWLSKPAMLTSCGRLVGELAKQFGIPLTQLTSSQAQGSSKGICEHKNFGSGGGNHTDCGNGFPMDEIIRIAKGGGGASSAPAPPKEVADMTAAVAYVGGQAHLACIGKDNNNIYYKAPGQGWGTVDPGSNAKSGLTMAASPDGALTIVYTNQGNAVCTYHKGPGAKDWVWSNQGGQAK